MRIRYVGLLLYIYLSKSTKKMGIRGGYEEDKVGYVLLLYIYIYILAIVGLLRRWTTEFHYCLRLA